MSPGETATLYAPAAFMALVMLYWLLVIFGAAGLEALDIDVDLDPDFDAEAPVAASLGFMLVRFFNIGGVPLMIWLTVFAPAFFAVSYFWNDPSYGEHWLVAVQMTLRNAVIVLFITKLLTQPLVGKFDAKPMTSHRQLVGLECVITTAVADANHGQISVKSEAAPFLMNAHTTGETLNKGDAAMIVEYRPRDRLCIIERLVIRDDAAEAAST